MITTVNQLEQPLGALRAYTVWPRRRIYTSIKATFTPAYTHCAGSRDYKYTATPPTTRSSKARLFLLAYFQLLTVERLNLDCG